MPNLRSYWSMISFHFAGPAWTVYTLVWFLTR